MVLNINNRKTSHNIDKLYRYCTIMTDYKICFEVDDGESYHTKIEFINELNENIDKYLHEGLTHLRLGEEFNQPLDNLPLSLQYLDICGNYKQRLDKLPPGLQELSLIFDYNSPSSMISFNKLIKEVYNYYDHSLDNLPNSLLKFKIDGYFHHTLDSLPNSILDIVINNHNSHLRYLPNKLSTLFIGNNFIHPLPHLPDTLQELQINKKYIHTNFILKRHPSLKIHYY